MKKFKKYKSKIHLGNTQYGVINNYPELEKDLIIQEIQIQVFEENFKEPNFHIFFPIEKIEIEISIKTLKILNYWCAKPKKNINYLNWDTYQFYKSSIKNWLLETNISGIQVGFNKKYTNYYSIAAFFDICNGTEIPFNIRVVKLFESPKLNTDIDSQILHNMDIFVYIEDRPKFTPHFHLKINDKNSVEFEVSLKDLTILKVKGLTIKESEKYKYWDGFKTEKEWLINWLKNDSSIKKYNKEKNYLILNRIWDDSNPENKLKSNIMDIFNSNFNNNSNDN
jgi:hypothetical protein